jgi:prephenate dehydrogenase
MTTQITIIGTGQIGTSIGLALASYKDQVKRVGHDRDSKWANQAQKMGALDKVHFNLPSAVADADIVLLSVPVSEVRDTLTLIAPDLKEGAVVLDTSPVRDTIGAWAVEILPSGRSYVGITPMLNPLFLHHPECGTEAADADLFMGGMFAISAPRGTSSGAIKLATDLTEMIGATPLFADVAEVDGLMSATHLLPQIIAALLVNVTAGKPGWQEGRKFAGRAYAQSTNAIANVDTSVALAKAAMLNKENILRLLGDLHQELELLLGEIREDKEEAIFDRLNSARSARESWWSQRKGGNWQAEALPPVDASAAPNVLGRLIGFGRKADNPED